METEWHHMPFGVIIESMHLFDIGVLPVNKTSVPRTGLRLEYQLPYISWLAAEKKIIFDDDKKVGSPCFIETLPGDRFIYKLKIETRHILKKMAI